MRRPRKLAHSPIHALIAALPDEALRPLILQLLNGAGAPEITPVEDDPAPTPRRAYKRRPESRPPSRKRRGPGRPRKPAGSGDVAEKIIARRQREARRLREKRAAAKLAKAEQAPAETSNGKVPAKVSAAALWEHAELLAPKTRWRAVAKEFGANEAQMLDCYRARGLPPGVAVNAIERFLELAPTA